MTQSKICHRHPILYTPSSHTHTASAGDSPGGFLAASALLGSLSESEGWLSGVAAGVGGAGTASGAGTGEGVAAAGGAGDTGVTGVVGEPAGWSARLVSRL